MAAERTNLTDHDLAMRMQMTLRIRRNKPGALADLLRGYLEARARLIRAGVESWGDRRFALAERCWRTVRRLDDAITLITERR